MMHRGTPCRTLQASTQPLLLINDASTHLLQAARMLVVGRRAMLSDTRPRWCFAPLANLPSTTSPAKHNSILVIDIINLQPEISRRSGLPPAADGVHSVLWPSARIETRCNLLIET